MNKKCNTCGIVKPLRDFTVALNRKHGRHSVCRNCKRLYDAAYRQANKGRIRKKKKMEYSKDRDRIKSRIKAYNNCSAPFKTYAAKLAFAENTIEGDNGELFVFCAYCGKLYSPKIRAVQHRIEAINGKTKGEARLYCSEACKRACPSYGQIMYWKFQEPATSREVSFQFRQLVLKRDNWTCQRCGAGVKAELHVHHIEGAVQQPGMSNDLENGITLCKICHKKVHDQLGCRYHEMRCPKK